MKIFVMSKERMIEMVKLEGLNPNDFYITVKCPIETDYAIGDENDRVLKLDFNDSVAPEEGVILFSKKMADAVIDFFHKMLDSKNDESRLYVNCGAGVSRSGAIGEAANIFFNRLKEENDEDYYKFYQVNPQIQPNLRVKEMLMRRILF